MLYLKLFEAVHIKHKHLKLWLDGCACAYTCTERHCYKYEMYICTCVLTLIRKHKLQNSFMKYFKMVCNVLSFNSSHTRMRTLITLSVAFSSCHPPQKTSPQCSYHNRLVKSRWSFWFCIQRCCWRCPWHICPGHIGLSWPAPYWSFRPLLPERFKPSLVLKNKNASSNY